MTSKTKVANDAHSHIRRYNTEEQPELIAATESCKTQQELCRLWFLNMERYYEWSVAHKAAMDKKRSLLSEDAYFTAMGFQSEITDAHRKAAMRTSPIVIEGKCPKEDWSVDEVMKEVLPEYGEQERRREEQTDRSPVLLATIGRGCVLVESLNAAV